MTWNVDLASLVQIASALVTGRFYVHFIVRSSRRNG